MKKPSFVQKHARSHRLVWLSAAIFGLSAPILSHAADTPTKVGAKSMSASQPGANKGYNAMRASKIIGMKVENPQGKDLGKISDMIVDMGTGNVRYAVLEFDPGIFKSERLFAVPLAKLGMASDGDSMTYNTTPDQLKKAAIPGNDWNSAWRDSDHLSKMDKVWGIAQPTDGPKAHRVSDLLGKDVNNREGKKIGEIKELVVNMAAQKVHYAVLEFDPSLASREQNFAFPLRAFNLTGDRDDLVLDVDKAKLEAMKIVTNERYSALNDRAWVADLDRSFVVVATPVAGKSGMNKRAGDMFDKLDTNKDGNIDRQEFDNAHKTESGTMKMKQ